MNNTTLKDEKTAGTMKTLEIEVVEIEVEELEAIIAPGMYRNHNETVVLKYRCGDRHESCRGAALTPTRKALSQIG